MVGGKTRRTDAYERSGWTLTGALARVRPPALPRPLAFALAPAAVLLAAVLQALLLGRPPLCAFLFFFPCVAVVSWVAGRLPGMLAAGLSTIAGNDLISEPYFAYSLAAPELIETTVFAVSSALVAILSSSFRGAFAEVRVLDKHLHRAEERMRDCELHAQSADEVTSVAAEVTGFNAFDYRPQTGELLCSDQTRRTFGLPEGEHIGYDALLKCLHAADRDRVGRAIQAALRRDGDGRCTTEFRTIHPQNGTERWLRARAKVFFDEHGLPVRLVGGGVDITHEKLDEVRERLFGVVGHDLRTPLSTIKMAADELRRTLPPQHAKAVGIIATSADRMNRMVTQLLDFTRVRFAAGIGLEYERFDLGKQCGDLLTEIAVAHPQRAIQLRVLGQPTGVWDKNRLSQVLSNLVGNALAHGRSDRPVEVVVCGEGPDVTVSVHNEGTPIPANDLGLIFDPFRRARRPPWAARSESGGLGLGLYIARAIVHAHGGHIDVRSTHEEGTTFTVHLPRELPTSPLAS